jgi:AcrR family transcriptional regulator
MIREKPMSSPATVTKTRMPPSDATLGQREKNKIDKLRRIKEAAQELFLSKGFDDTTTREIAVRAGVGIGTVFIYADNKRDLVFLVANDELAEITDGAEASVREDASCLQNLLTVFRHHYEFFGRRPELSRLMLREMTFYDTGRQAGRFQATRERVIGLVGRIMKLALERGMIRPPEDASFVGWVAFSIYATELRQWLMTKHPDVDEGMAQLRRALQLFLQGLTPSQECMILPERLRRPARRPAKPERTVAKSRRGQKRANLRVD